MQQQCFVDDAKLTGADDSLKGHEALQEDPDKLEHWTIINGTKFNHSKCQVLQLGQVWNTQHNARRRYDLERSGWTVQ